MSRHSATRHLKRVAQLLARRQRGRVVFTVTDTDGGIGVSDPDGIGVRLAVADA
jgi:hypothetical protein